MRKKNEENQKISFLAQNPELSPNGLYAVMGGTTFPNPAYCIIRTERSGIFWGGIYVLEYIKSGVGYIETDGAVHKVTAGDLVFMHAKRNITYYSDPVDPYEKVWLNFTGPLTSGMVDGIGLDKNVYIIKYPGESAIKEIHGLFNGINDKNRDEAYNRMASIVFRVLLEINTQSRLAAGGIQSNTAAERVKAYIDGLALPNVSLDDIADNLGLNKNYLIHSFKQRFGIPPNKYLISKKIETAKNMLTNKKMSISETSNALRYSSTQHFSKAFRQVTGVSPGVYKKLFISAEGNM
jgi:AraC-like DNA-binding protein